MLLGELASFLQRRPFKGPDIVPSSALSFVSVLFLRFFFTPLLFTSSASPFYLPLLPFHPKASCMSSVQLLWYQFLSTTPITQSPCVKFTLGSTNSPLRFQSGIEMERTTRSQRSASSPTIFNAFCKMGNVNLCLLVAECVLFGNEVV